jgi:nucleoside-diphosphate-sugar epimerase
MTKRALILGGPGTLSASTIQLLLEKSYKVAVFSHSKLLHELPTGVQIYAGDRHHSNDLQSAFDDFKPDVLLDFICFTPQEAEQTKQLVSGKVRQFVFVSTVDVYGYPLSQLPLPETALWHPETQSQYAADKRQCEVIFKSADPKQLPLTIVRPAYSFGPRFILSFTSRAYGIHMLRRLRDGRPVLVPGDGTTLMHVGSAHDTGRMIATVADSPLAIGNEYTCGHPEFTTHSGYLNLFAHSLGVEPRPVHIPTEVIASHPEPEARTCLLHALTRFNVAFSVERFKHDFPEFKWEVKLEDWAKHVVDWNLKQGILDAPDEEIFDDRVIDAWQKCIRSFGVS